jgi:hypothetical protein
VGGRPRAGVQLDWGWRAADDKVAVVDLYDGPAMVSRWMTELAVQAGRE